MTIEKIDRKAVNQMRERLIELIQKSVNGCARNRAETIADYLIEKGVLVAPMPMAEWLRDELNDHIHKRCMEEL